MVTHELDIASYSKRTVVMRDGRIVGNQPVVNRLTAAAELAKLRQEQKAIQLTS